MLRSVSRAMKSGPTSRSRTLCRRMRTPSSITMLASASSTICAPVMRLCLRPWSTMAETMSRDSLGTLPPYASTQTFSTSAPFPAISSTLPRAASGVR